jgi:hypothetical protein
VSAGGILFAAGLGILGAGAFHVVTRPRPLDGVGLLALGAAVIGAACVMMSKGV